LIGKININLFGNNSLIGCEVLHMFIDACFDPHIRTQISHYARMEKQPGSSVSIVSGYWLDYRAIKVRSPAEARGFFL
jgi:hypothetical protein